jgi:hypothetical protein
MHVKRDAQHFLNSFSTLEHFLSFLFAVYVIIEPNEFRIKAKEFWVDFNEDVKSTKIEDYSMHFLFVV